MPRERGTATRNTTSDAMKSWRRWLNIPGRPAAGGGGAAAAAAVSRMDIEQRNGDGGPEGEPASQNPAGKRGNDRQPGVTTSTLQTRKHGRAGPLAS